MEEFFSGDRRDIEAEGLGDSGFAQGVRLIEATEKLTRPVHLVMHRLGADEAQCDMLLEERGEAMTLIDLLGGTSPPLLLCRTPDGVGFFARDSAVRFESPKLLRLANTLLRIGITERTVQNLLSSARQVCKSDKDVAALDQALADSPKSDLTTLSKSGRSGGKSGGKAAPKPSGKSMEPSAPEVADLMAALDQALDEGNDEFVAQIRSVLATLDAEKPGGPRILQDFWRTDPSRPLAPANSAPWAARIRSRLQEHECRVADQDRKQRADTLLKTLETKGLRFEFSPEMEIVFAQDVKYDPAVHAHLMLDCLDQLAGTLSHDPHFTYGVAKLLREASKPDEFDTGSCAVLHAIAGLTALDSSTTREEAQRFASKVCDDAFERIVANCVITIETLANANDPYQRSCAFALLDELNACFGKQKIPKASRAALERATQITRARGLAQPLTIPEDAARALVEQSNPDLLPVIEMIHDALAKLGHQPALAQLQCFAPYFGEAAAGSNGCHLLVVLADHPQIKAELYRDWAHAIRQKDDVEQVFALHLETVKLSMQLDAARREDADRVVATRILISRVTIAIMCLARSLEIHVAALGLRFEAKSTPAGRKKTMQGRLTGRPALQLQELESYARSNLAAVGKTLLAMASKPELDALRKSMVDEVASLERYLDSVWHLSP